MSSPPSKEEHLRGLQTVDEVRGLLVDLLPRLGFVLRPAAGTGRPEVIVASRNNPLEGRPDHFAFVVVPEGAASNEDGVDRSVQLVQEGARGGGPVSVRVVTPRSFSNTAESQVRERSGYSDVHFWDGNHLRTLIDRAYPEYWQVGTDDYKKYAARALERFRSDYAVTALRLRDQSTAELFEGILLPYLLEHVVGDEGASTMRPAPVENVLDPGGIAMVAGEAGSGKSTLLRLLAERVIREATPESQRFPVLLKFRDLARVGFDVERSVEEFLTGRDFADLEIDASAVLSEGRAVVFIDALDEVARPELKEEAVDAVLSFAEERPEVKVVCTSRSSDRLLERSKDGAFDYFVMAPLRPDQIQRFITQYFNDDTVKGERLLQALEDNELLEKLPRTPLTLTLIAAIFEESSLPEVPATVAGMYGRFVGLLTGRLTATNRVGIIEADIHNDALEALALRLHTERHQAIEVDEFHALTRAFVEERGGASADTLGEDLLGRSGLLFVADDGRVQFKHLSFQEYFTAHAYFRRDDLGDPPFIERFNDPWWQDVAVFYGGLSRRASKLLERILTDARPSTIPEFILGLGGLGRLLQALYGTPVEQRQEAVRAALGYAVEALRTIERTGEPRYRVLQSFSLHAWITVFRWYFAQSFRSITLVEPMERAMTGVLEEMAELASADGDVEDEVFNAEFQMLLLAATLADRGLERVGGLRDLALYSRSNSLPLLAAEATFAKSDLRHLVESDRLEVSKPAKKAQRKLVGRMQQLGDISDKVNGPIRPKELGAPAGTDAES